MNREGQSSLIEPLTEREEDVLALLLEGKTNREIAEELVLSMNTVKWYNRQIYGKLGVENREGIAERARELGLVGAGEPEKRPKYNLPHPATPLLGRERELEELENLLLDGRTRIVSIIGPGGMGKTRLAIELAQRLNGRYPDGVTFVALAPLLSEESIVPAIAQSLRFTLQGGGLDEKTQLLNFLREKKLLIVLDNFEHLIDSAPLFTEIAETAPMLKMVVTSRERLKLQIEQLYPLQSLPLIDWEALEQANEDPAVQLFLEYGQRVSPNFELQTNDLEALHQIMQLVDGMPLAIILASAWLELLTVGEIAAEIQKNIDFLEADYQDLPGRQRSMRAVFDASWNQLNEEEQKVFTALSVFRGGFTLDAARNVVGATPGILLGLVSRSLLNRDENGRFEIHELLRQFGDEALAADPDRKKEIFRRHSIHYCTFLGEREADLKGTRATETEAEITADYENVRAAWYWAADNVEELVYQAQTGLGIFFEREGRGYEGEAAFLYAQARLAERETVDARRMAELLAWGSNFATWRSQEQAHQLIQRALAYLNEAAAGGEDIRAERAFVLLVQSRNNHPPALSVQFLEESLSLYQELGRLWEMAWVHINFALIYIGEARYRVAQEHLNQTLQLCEKVGDRRWAIWTKIHIARNMAWMGQLAEAKERLQEAILLCKAIGDDLGATIGRLHLGQVLLLSGHFKEALAPLARSRAQFAIQSGSSLTAHIYFCWTKLHLGRYHEVFYELHSVLHDDLKSDYKKGLASFVLGSAELALARIDEARVYLRESATLFSTTLRHEELSKAQAALGYLALSSDDTIATRVHLVEAFRPVPDAHLFIVALMALPLAAVLIAKLGEPERAIELYALASTYGYVANSRWFYDVAGRKLDAITTSLPLESVTAAQERGRGLDLWQTAESLLKELNEGIQTEP